MTTTLFYGRQPVGYEADAVARLRRELDAAGINAYLFANFEVDGIEIDLLVVKRDGIYLVEFKSVGGQVVGAVNGEWKVLNGNGEYLLPGGRGENPFQQMRTGYTKLSKWLEFHKTTFLAPYAATVTHFRFFNPEALPIQIRSLLTFYPELPEGSQLDIAHPIQAISFTELSAILLRPLISRSE